MKRAPRRGAPPPLHLHSLPRRPDFPKREQVSSAPSDPSDKIVRLVSGHPCRGASLGLPAGWIPYRRSSAPSDLSDSSDSSDSSDNIAHSSDNIAHRPTILRSVGWVRGCAGRRRGAVRQRGRSGRSAPRHRWAPPPRRCGGSRRSRSVVSREGASSGAGTSQFRRRG